MLEDNHEDIIAKAMRGKKIGKAMLADLANVNVGEIERLLAGEVIESAISVIAPVLKLDTEKLLFSAGKEWVPESRKLVGVKQFVSDFGSMTVNAYVVFEQNSKRAWIFDTGTECDSLISFIEEEGLKVDSILLTHTHRDHIHCLDELKRYFIKTEVFVHISERLDGTISVKENFQRSMGSLTLKSLHTHGHSAGGMTYNINGLPCPVAIVGDALFAGSMGGGMVSYDDALRTNREKIMTLPENTILCPGHGPTTTVGEEKENNPFFPEF